MWSVIQNHHIAFKRNTLIYGFTLQWYIHTSIFLAIRMLGNILWQNMSNDMVFRMAKVDTHNVTNM